MSLISILNLLIVNILIWVALSYFWSFWTHRLFKPWAWLEARKSKQTTRAAERAERAAKDRVRFYAHFFALQQIERHEVPGAIAFLGLEQTGLLCLARATCPERTIVAAGAMEPRTVQLTHENCQSVVSQETIAIDYVAEEDVRQALPASDARNRVVRTATPSAALAQSLDAQPGTESCAERLALVSIDLVEPDELLLCLQAAYARLAQGGILIVHSVNHTWPAVRDTVDHFCATVPEGYAPLPDQYGSVMMVKGKEGFGTLSNL